MPILQQHPDTRQICPARRRLRLRCATARLHGNDLAQYRPPLHAQHIAHVQAVGGLQRAHPGRGQLADRGQHLPRAQGRQQLHRIGDRAGLPRCNSGQRKAQAAPIGALLRHNRLAIQLRTAGQIAIAQRQTV